MNNVLNGLWTGYVQPMLQRPNRVQLAALCYRMEESGKKILLITSRGTGRWIIPKGWPIAGTSSHGTALQEAWEEAGVRDGIVGDEPLGSYTYDKDFKSDWSAPVTTIVYPVAVSKMKETFPEMNQRTREWVTPLEAAKRVREPELQDMFRKFA